MPLTIGQRQNAQRENIGLGIRRADFDNSEAYPSLIGMNSWTPNSGLSIITGVNGIGKTQLLNYIETCLKNTNCRDLYVESSFTPSVNGIADFGLVKEEFLRRFHNINYLFQPDVLYGGDQRDLDVRENFRKKILARVRISYLLKYRITDIDRIMNHFDLRHRVENIIQHEPIEFRPGITTSNQFISILDTVLQAYVRAGHQEEAIAGINLALNKFKHEVFIKFADTPNPQIGFRTKGNNPLEVRPEKFSSGEKMILTFLTIKYAQSGIPTINGAVQHGNNQVNVILLDEPDRHFHPKFIKELYTIVKDTLVKELKIQVIITTHNPSTVALADDSELLVMEQKGDEPTRIRQCTKLLALAKLSREIQTYTGMHVKVFTESFDDAKFYEGIYANLMKYSSIIREHKSQGIAAVDPFLDELSTLSRRYQMGFYPASFEAGKDGGWKKVFDAVRMSVAAQDAVAGDAMYSDQNSFVANLFRAYRVDAPFGIIDRDYNNRLTEMSGTQFILPEFLRYKFERLARHSLECFMCDPIILCSIFNEVNEIENWFNDARYKLRLKNVYRELFPENNVINNVALNNKLNLVYKEIYRTCLNENRFIDEFKRIIVQKITSRYNNVYELRFENMATNIVDNFIQYSNENYEVEQANVPLIILAGASNPRIGISDVKKVAKNLIDDKNYYHSKFSKSIELRNVYNSMRIEFDTNTFSLEDTYIIFADQNEIEVITIQYPTSLKSLRGHNLDYALREYLIDEFNGVKFKDMMFSRIMQMSIGPNVRLIIPVELAQTILNLNSKIKRQIIEKADPGKFAQMLEEENIGEDIAMLFMDDDFHLRTIEKKSLFVKQISGFKDFLQDKTLEIACRSCDFNELHSKFSYSPSKVGINIFGNINLIPETSHLFNHGNNILKIIYKLNKNEFNFDNIICLERKQYGKNLGISDVMALANHLERGNALPAELQQLPIYHDALLYNAAKAKGVQVIGIEGKGLAHSKESSYYHQAREEYMAEQLLAIARSGKNAIFLVGSAHINNLVKLLGTQGFIVDNSDLALEQNLITLKPEQIILTREFTLPKVSADIIRIANYEYRVEDNSQLETENLLHEAVQSHSFLSYMHEFAEQLDLNWQLQKLFYFKDLWKFESLKARYGITASFDTFRGSNSNFRKSVLLKLHPDKNPSIGDASNDFAFVTNLREELNKAFDVQKFINEKIQTIQRFIYKVNLGCKVTDSAVDTVRLIYMPTIDNAKKILMDVAHIYSMYTGVNVYSTLITSYNVIYKIYEREYSQALSQASTSMSYMLLPNMLASFGIPHIGFVYSISLAIYGGFNTITNIRSLYNEFNQQNFKLDSNIAYQKIAEILSTTCLQNLYNFKAKAMEYEKAAYKIKLAERYDLENNLKAKHIKLMDYDRCIEVAELKEEQFDHYYCYNEEQQVLDHIITIGESFIEKIGSL